MINIDDGKVVYDRLKKRTVKDMATKELTSDIRFYAFSSNVNDKLKEELETAGYSLFNKPSSSQILDVLRHMVPGENLLQVDDAKVKRA